MKYVSFVAILLLSCSKSDPTPTVPATVTTYTTLVGNWKFATTNGPTSGEFKVANFSGDLVVDSDFGQFTVNGKKYVVGTRHKMESGTTPGTFNRFWLIDATNNNQFVFDNAEISSDFTKITAKNFYYSEGSKASTYYTETVVITRE